MLPSQTCKRIHLILFSVCLFFILQFKYRERMKWPVVQEVERSREAEASFVRCCVVWVEDAAVVQKVLKPVLCRATVVYHRRWEAVPPGFYSPQSATRTCIKSAW